MGRTLGKSGQMRRSERFNSHLDNLNEQGGSQNDVYT